MKRNIKGKMRAVESAISGDLTVDEFFNDYAMAQIGRNKRLDVRFKRNLIEGLSEFLAKRHRNMTPEEFVNLQPPKCDDMMSEFANWMKKNKKIDVYQNFDDYYLRDRVSDDDGVDTYDDVSSEMNGKTRWSEGSGSKAIDEWGIFDFIDQELADAEWVADANSTGTDTPTLSVTTTDGDKYDISVKRAGESQMNESSDCLSRDKKLALWDYIDQYVKEKVNAAKGDRSARMASKMALDRLSEFIGSL